MQAGITWNEFMLTDARRLPQDTEIEADICIIGAGAAGITLAREFVGQPFKVCLVESGGLDFDDETQSLYEGDLVGLPGTPLDASRLRFFGGSTNHWAGVCRPLDADVFEPRSWIPYSGWPITRAELDPYYERAHGVVQIGPYDYDPETWNDALPEFFRLPLIDGRLEPAVFQMSPPTRFGEVYREELVTAPNVETCLYGNVVDIETNDTASSVSRVRVACLEANEFWVKAKVFILATGGIENPRLLLLANKVQTAGLGNAHDAVGRFYMNHPRLDAAWIMLNEPSSPALRPISSVGEIVTRLKVSERTAAEEGIARFAAWIYPAEASGKRPQSEGYKSLRWVLRLIRNGQLSTEILTHLRHVAADLDDVVTDVIAKYSDQPLISIEPEYEQVPNPDSRVLLGADRDALGQNRVQVDWRFTALDKFSLRRSLEIVGEEVGRTGVGRLKIDDWVMNDDLSSFPGEDRWHPAGTTRMSDNPKTGVVDKHCRVHGIENLYVAGGSVFPTIGFANPTLTIVAMTLRLGDHLKTAMA